MSYILEALEKAEAERALGAVPSLHAQVAISPPPRLAARQRLLLGLPLALGVVLALAAVAWYRQPVPVVVVGPQPQPPSGSAAAAAVPAVAPPAEAPRPPVAARPMPQPGAVKTPRPVPASEPPRLKKSTQLANAAGLDERLLTLQDLPEQIQHDIPALTVGGYIYSDNRAERSLLINNKLLREGDEVAAGLRLEKMMPGAAVLNYKGYRYRIAY